MKTGLLQKMRDHDANEETRYLHEGRINIGWGWMWLDWQFGLAAFMDPREKPGIWLNLGPLTIGAFRD